MRDFPKLRALDIQPINYEGRQMWLLRDPLELSDMQLVLAAPLVQTLVYCDGTRDVEGIRAAMASNLGVPVDYDIIKDTINQLNEACLLENERSAKVKRTLLETYRQQESREPSLAGLGYSADPFELTSELMAYGEGDDLANWSPWRGRGIISPHIDYQRGGDVYSHLWRRAEIAVKEAELVVILGTDHYGSDGSITLTSRPYKTPFGVLPTDPELITLLSDAIGSDAFEEELHHRKEHSVELSATWLHFVNDRKATPMIPVLCGSFAGFIHGDQEPQEDEKIGRFVETLRESTADRKVLVVASVDFAHVGPNFGDSFVMDESQRERLVQEDERLIEAITAGDALAFYDQIASVKDKNRVCGTSSMYLLLRYLGSTTGKILSYKHCPADQQNTSLVSICGILLD
ncbi:MAG: AmmeMemoRadiSam system protein B [Candidatus Promineifilaceae bacterium]